MSDIKAICAFWNEVSLIIIIVQSDRKLRKQFGTGENSDNKRGSASGLETMALRKRLEVAVIKMLRLLGQI